MSVWGTTDPIASRDAARWAAAEGAPLGAGWSCGAPKPLATPRPEAAGRSPGPLMGDGGMGVIVHAHKGPLLGAAKIFGPRGGRQAALQARFQREIELTVQLQHEHTVHVHDLGVLEDGLPLPKGARFFVMEVLHGRSLRDVLRDARAWADGRRRSDAVAVDRAPPQLTARSIFQIVEQTGRALAYAHSAPVPIVHHDVKPENLFLHQPPRVGPAAAPFIVKLLDYGVAAFAGEENDKAMGGSIPYLPPEAAEGAPASVLFDIYALGMVTYQLLTLQQSPWPGHAFETMDDVRAAHSGPAPVPPSAYARWLHKRLDQVVLRAVSADPARRPAHVLEFVEELRALSTVDDGSAGWHPDVVTTDHDAALARPRARAGVKVSEAPGATRTLASPGRPLRAAAALLVASGAAAVWGARTHRPQPPVSPPLLAASAPAKDSDGPALAHPTPSSPPEASASLPEPAPLGTVPPAPQAAPRPMVSRPHPRPRPADTRSIAYAAEHPPPVAPAEPAPGARSDIDYAAYGAPGGSSSSSARAGGAPPSTSSDPGPQARSGVAHAGRSEGVLPP